MLMVMDTKKFRPIFVTGTGTDIGKTYVTALLCKELKAYLEQHAPLTDSSLKSVAYYKAAISGADDIASSDAGQVNKIAALGQELSSLTSYLYQEAVSPHLAQKHEGSESISLLRIKHDFKAVYDQVQLTVLEGSGGIYCPLCWDYNKRPYLTGNESFDSSLALTKSNPENSCVYSNINESCYTISDFMMELNKDYDLSIVVVGDAALGCINNVVMTLNSLRAEGFDLNKVVIILNNFVPGDAMYEDNFKMIESMTHVPIIATLERNATKLNLNAAFLKRLLVPKK